MPSRPPPPAGGQRAAAGDAPVVRRVPIAMSVALEVVAELRARERESIPSRVADVMRMIPDRPQSER